MSIFHGVQLRSQAHEEIKRPVFRYKVCIGSEKRSPPKKQRIFDHIRALFSSLLAGIQSDLAEHSELFPDRDRHWDSLLPPLDGPNRNHEYHRRNLHRVDVYEYNSSRGRGLCKSCLDLRQRQLDSFQVFVQELQVTIREYDSGLYSLMTYFLCKIIAALPFRIVLPTSFVTITYSMMGLIWNLDRFLLSLMCLITIYFVATGFGYFISTITSSLNDALLLAPASSIPLVMFAGLPIHLE